MVVMMPRESWTDERLDDFRGDVNRRFDAVDRRFDRVEGEIQALRAEMRAGFERIDERFERLHRMMFAACAGVIGTLIAASAGLIATQL